MSEFLFNSPLEKETSHLLEIVDSRDEDKRKKVKKNLFEMKKE